MSDEKNLQTQIKNDILNRFRERLRFACLDTVRLLKVADVPAGDQATMLIAVFTEGCVQMVSDLTTMPPDAFGRMMGAYLAAHRKADPSPLSEKVRLRRGKHRGPA